MGMNKCYARQILKGTMQRSLCLGRKEGPYLVGGLMNSFIRKEDPELDLEEWITLLQ